MASQALLNRRWGSLPNQSSYRLNWRKIRSHSSITKVSEGDACSLEGGPASTVTVVVGATVVVGGSTVVAGLLVVDVAEVNGR